jgi:hypothetical protein
LQSIVLSISSVFPGSPLAISGDAGRMHDCRRAHTLDVDRIRNHSFARRSRRKPTPERIARSARAGGAPPARLEALIAANIGDLIAVTVFTFCALTLPASAQ